MKSRRRILLCGAAALVLLLGWIFRPAGKVRQSPAPQETVSENRRSSPANRAPRGVPAQANPGNDPARPAGAPDSNVARLIEHCLERFRAAGGEEQSRTILQELRDGIRGADPESAAAAISAFLKSGKDAATDLPFAVGPEGIMELTPTLRTALLDLLLTVDPLAALEVARAIMNDSKSPDEYALALRNVASNDLDGDLKNEIRSCLERMIETQDWSANPSAGFLEALDAAVLLVDKQMFDTIARLLGEAAASGNSSLARAGLMALDRMLVRDPSLLVQSFGAGQALPELPPDQRASLMSRLDVTDPAQRELFTRYVSAPNHGPAELEYFAALFPNGNFLHGNWLITAADVTHSIASRREEDRKVLAEIDRLLAGELQGSARETLVSIRERLTRVAGDSESVSPE